jgi:RNA polymerase sigma-70 factor (ECF subfamily)
MRGDRDESLFRTWLNDYRGILLKVARSFADNAQDREDLIQEILIRLWAAMPSWREQSKPSTWIYRVALNRALTWKRDEIRRAGRNVPLLETVDHREGISRTDELVNQLYQHIRGLGEIDRALILMSLDGCTYQEMSEVMGMTENNVGVRLNRAKKTLSRAMSEHADDL